MTAGERRRGSDAAAAACVVLITFFLMATVAIDTAGALPTWRRLGPLGFRTGTGVRDLLILCHTAPNYLQLKPISTLQLFQLAPHNL